MIKRILLGLGGTPFTDVAIERAVELAKAHGALITGVTVMDVKQLKQVGPVPLGGGAYASTLREKRLTITEERIEEAIEKVQEKCAESDILTKIERETGDPFESMIAHARYNDVIIFGLRSLFDYGFTSEAKDALIRLVSQVSVRSLRCLLNFEIFARYSLPTAAQWNRPKRCAAMFN